jgi:hypothetical protein
VAPNKSTSVPDLPTQMKQRAAKIPYGTKCAYRMHIGGIARIGGATVSIKGKKRTMPCPKWAVRIIDGRHFCDQHA